MDGTGGHGEREENDTFDEDRDDSALERRPTCRDIPGVFISIPRSGEGTTAAARE